MLKGWEKGTDHCSQIPLMVPLMFSFCTKSLGVAVDHGGFNFPLHWGPPWGPPLLWKIWKSVDPKAIDEFWPFR